MKKLISIAAAISMLAAMPAVTAFAESPASSDLTNEERVAEGIAAYELELEHCKNVKKVSAKDTLDIWNQHFEDYNNQYYGGADIDELFKEVLRNYYVSKIDSSETSESDASVTAAQAVDFDVNNYLDPESIDKDRVFNRVVEIVKNVMPPDEFERMESGGDYKLYYIDGYIIRTTKHTEGVSDLVGDISLISDLSSGDICSVMYTLFINDIDVFKHVYSYIFLVNERNRELSEIETEMVKLGFWGVEDEEADIPSIPYDNDDVPFKGEPTFIPPAMIIDLASGDDTYRVHDADEPVYAIISEQGEGKTGDDTLFLDYDLDIDDLEFIRINGDLYINDNVHEVYLILKEYFSNSAKRIENIKFRDGSIMTYEDVCYITNSQVGTSNDDTINGYTETNYIWGIGGNDKIYGDQSDDYMLGGDGDDTITLADNCLGMLFAEAGNNYAYGMNGNDTIILGDGDDFIWGGKGDDVIRSGGGNDIIYYELGDGNDYIDDTNGKGMYPSKGYDVLWLGEGISSGEVQVTFSDNYNEFNLTISRTGEKITMPGNMYSGTTPVFPIEEIHFADGTTWNRLDLLERTRYHYGSNEDDVLTAVVDTDAEFRKDYTPDAVLFGFGGNDVLTGAKGNDIIWGGTGDDIMRGGNGDDIFYYDFGDGNDLIDLGKQGGNNILLLGEGIEPDEVTIERSVDDYTYILHINATGETVSIAGNVMGYFDFNFPMKAICFDDGTVWDQEYLQANFVKYIRGTDGDDTINDTGDNDTVFCGKGNDFIKGRSGDDLYIYELGDGCDTIDDSTLWGNGYNTLQFGEGISLDDIYIENSEYDGKKYTRFYIRDRESYIQVIGINEVIFADGGSMTFDEFKNAVRSASELS
ncbi:calcium-binding protein [Ruminococcus sp.]|uniref:calcium-binding protein n=1 Tax=Ruminococcus sp. TaxID=41978 RepID=UPI0025D138BA|nr:calcium-binding protein [Ruminococcus sp.]